MTKLQSRPKFVRPPSSPRPSAMLFPTAQRALWFVRPTLTGMWGLFSGLFAWKWPNYFGRDCSILFTAAFQSFIFHRAKLSEGTKLTFSDTKKSKEFSNVGFKGVLQHFHFTSALLAVLHVKCVLDSLLALSALNLMLCDADILLLSQISSKQQNCG